MPRRWPLVCAVASLALAGAPPARAQLPPLPPLDPTLPDPLGLIETLKTHGLDPLSLGLVLEVPGPAGGPGGQPLDAGVPITADAVRRSLPEHWCGEERAADDTEHALANGDPRYHAVYAIASDAPSRIGELGSAIQSDAFQASALLESTYDRALRFDLGTVCGSQYLDISTLRLPQSTADLQAIALQANSTYQTILAELDRAGFDTIAPSEQPSAYAGRPNYVVWLDAPAPAGCGQGTFYLDESRSDSNQNNAGGKVALVFRSPDGVGFCNSNSARHEIGHNLGAVQPAAPHSNAGHCTETEEDTMCQTPDPNPADTYHALYFDVGNDDYWDPPGGALGWWTVNHSRYLCDVACNVPGGSEAVARQISAAGGDPNAQTTPEAGGSQPVARLTARRRGRRWRYRITVPGSGRAKVVVTCRRRGRRVRIKVKRVTLPANLRGRARCNTRPKVRVRLL